MPRARRRQRKNRKDDNYLPIPYDSYYRNEKTTRTRRRNTIVVEEHSQWIRSSPEGIRFQSREIVTTTETDRRTGVSSVIYEVRSREEIRQEKNYNKTSRVSLTNLTPPVLISAKEDIEVVVVPPALPETRSSTPTSTTSQTSQTTPTPALVTNETQETSILTTNPLLAQLLNDP